MEDLEFCKAQASDEGREGIERQEKAAEKVLGCQVFSEDGAGGPEGGVDDAGGEA